MISLLRIMAIKVTVTALYLLHLLFIGDSITFGYGGAPKDRYIYTSQQWLAGNTAINIAVAGNTAQQQLAVFEAFNPSLKQNINVAIIMLPINNINPTGTTVEDITAHLQELVDTVRAQLTPGSKIIIETMTPAGGGFLAAFGVNGPAAITQWRGVNANIMGTGDNPIQNVDYRQNAHTLALDSNGTGFLWNKFNSGDGTHPNKAGDSTTVRLGDIPALDSLHLLN